MPNVADLLPLPPGLVAITGDEKTGKTTLLRALAGELPDAAWRDLALADEAPERTMEAVWGGMQAQWPQWNAGLLGELVDALGLAPHCGKQLLMLSAGSRRKVALAGLLACGARVTCLDQPYGALDMASIRVLREFLADMAGHASRTWVVADYEADAGLRWARVIELAPLP